MNPAPAPCRVDGRYRLGRTLGVGASGTVYEATDEQTGARVALKLPHAAQASDPRNRSWFLREATLSAAVRHVHVAAVERFGETEAQTPYLVMDVLDGDSAQDILEQRGRLGTEYACQIAIQVLAALDALHGAGLLHLDVKPANIMVTHPQPKAPLVKLLDFGVATEVGAGGIWDAGGRLAGTPQYMSPEQAVGGALDARCDVYGAAATLFSLICGEPPVQGRDLTETVSRLITGRRRRLSDLRGDVPEGLADLVDRALSAEPEDRPQSAREFAAALRAFVAPQRLDTYVPSPAVSCLPVPLLRAQPDSPAAMRISLRAPLGSGSVQWVLSSGPPQGETRATSSSLLPETSAFALHGACRA